MFGDLCYGAHDGEMQPDSGLRLRCQLESEETNEGQVLQIHVVNTRVDCCERLHLECVAGEGMLRKRTPTTSNRINRATYQGRSHPKVEHKRQNARGMIGATVQQDVQVAQTHGSCQHSCLRSDDRFQFCCCLSIYASKCRPKYHVSVSTYCLLLTTMLRHTFVLAT